jgi:hypothetical protein
MRALRCRTRSRLFPLAKNSPLKPMLSATLEARNDAPLDLLAGFSCCFARPSVSPPGLIQLGNKSIAFDGCRLKYGQQLFEGLSRFLYLLNQGRSVHSIVKYHDTIYDSRYNQLYSAYKTLDSQYRKRRQYVCNDTSVRGCDQSY